MTMIWQTEPPSRSVIDRISLLKLSSSVTRFGPATLPSAPGAPLCPAWAGIHPVTSLVRRPEIAPGIGFLRGWDPANLTSRALEAP